MSPHEAIPPQEGARFWSQVGQGFARAARATGRAVASAYQAVDPDVRRHVAEVPLLGLTMLAPRQTEPHPLPADGHRPLVFVHGLGGRRGNFLPMQTWFRFRGRARSYAFSLPAGSLEGKSAALRTFLAQVLEHNELPADRQVDMVAHSMGGIVARQALLCPETSRRVSTLVTLGTPHGGTHAARYASTAHTLELRPDADLIQRLAESQTPWSGSTRLVCFGSAADVLMLPAATAFVEGAQNHDLPGYSHYGYLIYPDCWRRVFSALIG